MAVSCSEELRVVVATQGGPSQALVATITKTISQNSVQKVKNETEGVCRFLRVDPPGSPRFGAAREGGRGDSAALEHKNT